ncbi:MAG: hypothetical protein Q9161_000970 [Pseudevernia consocians]
MPDPFSTLPAPLPLMIFEAIEDLSTLNYLLHSSPAANVIFESYYCEITEAVLSHFIPQLQQLLRTVVLVRSDHVTVHDELDSPEALDNFLATRVLDNNAGTKPLSNATVSLSAVRSLTTSSSHVQQISSSFFEEFLDRVNGIKPSYFNDKLDDLMIKDYHRKLPQGHRYEPLRCGRPSWIEEQRVYRALWHVQLYLDLVTITRPSLGVTSLVWDLLKNEGPHRVWGKLKRHWEVDEMDCLYQFMCEFLDATARPSVHPPHLSKLPATERKFVTVPKPIPYDDYVSSQWCQTTKDLNYRSFAVDTFHAIVRSFHTTLYNSGFEPFQRPDFEPFRRLGFDIWDREKMAGLGLVRVPRFLKQPEFCWVGPVKSGSGMFEYYFRWKSLMVEKCKNSAGP